MTRSPSTSKAPGAGEAGTASGPGRDRAYGRGYYHGENSGYPKEGYRSAHPDWEPWLDLISRVKPPPGILFDCGTAFGYLPGAATARGYTSLGCDISSYALRQEPSFLGTLVQGSAEMLPLMSGSADIVCLFDVLEHLGDPVLALEEAVRILKPEGLLAGATPDPLYFDQHEETHCFERPPSFWIHHLERLGLRAVFRFSNIPENFQFLASFRNSATAEALGLFQHDHFSHDPDILEVRGEESPRIIAVLRDGWDRQGTEGRIIKGTSASVYLLNRSDSPVQCRVGIEISEGSLPVRFRLRFNSLVLDSFTVRPGETPSKIISGPFTVPGGGHHVHLDTGPSPVEALSVRSVSVEAFSTLRPGEHVLSLPFDLYQRYSFAGAVAGKLRPSSILDAGGNIGDQGGHLALSRDFLSSGDHPPETIISSDLRHCDHPGHVPGDALRLPFPADSFEIVVSLDVLEHIPPESRKAFLGELDRVGSQWILLGAPFSSPEVEKAEAELVSGLGLRFLEEHSELGLPREKMITDFFLEEKGRHILRFENGYLPRWFMMLPVTQLLFSMHNYSLFTSANRYYNELFYQGDCRAPGYRTFFLVSRDPLPEELAASLESLPGYCPEKEAFAEDCPGEFKAFPFYRDFLDLNESRSREMADLAFLLASREKYIGILEEQLDEYRGNPLIRIIRKLGRALQGGRKDRSSQP